MLKDEKVLSQIKDTKQQTPNNKAPSAWNQGGTWEVKNLKKDFFESAIT